MAKTKNESLRQLTTNHASIQVLEIKSATRLLDDCDIKEFITAALVEQKLNGRFQAEAVIAEMNKQGVYEYVRTEFNLKLFCESLLRYYQFGLDEYKKPAKLLEYFMLQCCINYISKYRPVYLLHPDNQHKKPFNRFNPYNASMVYRYSQLELEFLCYFAYYLIREDLTSSSFDAVNKYFESINFTTQLKETEAGVLLMDVLDLDGESSKYHFKDPFFMLFMAARFISCHLIYDYYKDETNDLAFPDFFKQVGNQSKVIKQDVINFVDKNFDTVEHRMLSKLIAQILKDTHGLNHREIVCGLRQSSLFSAKKISNRNPRLFKEIIEKLDLHQTVIYLTSLGNKEIDLNITFDNEKQDSAFQIRLCVLLAVLTSNAEYNNQSVFNVDTDMNQNGFTAKITSPSSYAIHKIEKILMFEFGEKIVKVENVEDAAKHDNNIQGMLN